MLGVIQWGGGAIRERTRWSRRRRGKIGKDGIEKR
jgi:hypothetical protein